MTAEERKEIATIIQEKISKTTASIREYKELTKPIPPENAIGRISRMDAINNKSVNEAALRQAELKLTRLKRAQKDVNEDFFGLCKKCGDEIQLGRLKYMPESLSCMECARK